MEVRDLWPAVGVAVGELRGKAMLGVAERMEKLLYRKAAAITCVTRSFVDYVAEQGIDREKSSFFPTELLQTHFIQDG